MSASPMPTLIITRGECQGGTLLTLQTARSAGKPHLVLDVAALSQAQAAGQVREWLAEIRPETLNVAGPRASKDPAIYSAAKAILCDALGSVRGR
jgi:hypothetical protein